jgi:hypothetical protein
MRWSWRELTAGEWVTVGWGVVAWLAWGVVLARVCAW